MSYSLVTVSCVVAFLSLIPPTRLAVVIEGSSDWTAIKDFVFEKSDLNPSCTAPIDGAMHTLVSVIQKEVTALTSTVSDDEIKNVVTFIFGMKKALDQSETTKIYALAAKEVLYPSKCAHVLPTLGTDLSSLRRILVNKASDEDVVAYQDWPSKSISAACLVFEILKALQASSIRFPAPPTEVVDEITAVVNAIGALTESSGIGSEDITPPVLLISDSYNNGKNNKHILDYIGSSTNQDIAKRCIVTCFYKKALKEIFNPQLPPQLKQKLWDHLNISSGLEKDCSAPIDAILNLMADDLIKPSKILAGSHKWMVLVTLNAFFEKAILTEREKEYARVSISRLSMPEPTCLVKSPLLGVDNQALVMLAVSKMEALCDSDSCGPKRLGFRCFIANYVDKLQASFNIEPIPNDIKEELKAAVTEHNRTLTTRSADDNAASADTINLITPLAQVTEVFIAAKDKTKTKEWMGNNAGKRALVVCTIDKLITGESSKPKDNKDNKDDVDEPGLSINMIVIIAVIVIIVVIVVVFAVCYHLFMRKR